MNYPAHLLIGILSVILILHFTGLQKFDNIDVWKAIPIIAIAALGSLLPDIDHNESKISKTFRPILVALIAILSFKSSYSYSNSLLYSSEVTLIAIALILIFSKLLKPKHRGITHSLLAALIFSGMIYLPTQSLSYTVSGIVSYSSHLIADKEIKLV